MIQYIILIIILICCVGYALMRIRKALGNKNQCEGCTRCNCEGCKRELVK